MQLYQLRGFRVVLGEIVEGLVDSHDLGVVAGGLRHVVGQLHPLTATRALPAAGIVVVTHYDRPGRLKQVRVSAAGRMCGGSQMGRSRCESASVSTLAMIQASAYLPPHGK